MSDGKRPAWEVLLDDAEASTLMRHNAVFNRIVNLVRIAERDGEDPMVVLRGVLVAFTSSFDVVMKEAVARAALEPPMRFKRPDGSPW